MKAWIDAVRRLTEAYYTTVSVESPYFTGTADVFENPTTAELGKLIREHESLRGFFDAADDVVYVWNASVLHHDVDVSGEAWLEISKTGVFLQIYGESAAEFWFPDMDFDLDDVEAKVRESRAMQPLLAGRKLIVTWR